jgi:hypothetical protein
VDDCEVVTSCASPGMVFDPPTLPLTSPPLASAITRDDGVCGPSNCFEDGTMIMIEWSLRYRMETRKTKRQTTKSDVKFFN